MKNIKRKCGLLVLVVLLCLWALAEPGFGWSPGPECPPEGCDECESCDWTTGYECVSDCTFGQKCCNDVCYDECDTITGEDCSGSGWDGVIVCDGCAMMNDTDCGWQGPARDYEGGWEIKCSPRGCDGDCDDGTKLCYTEYTCIVIDFGALFNECSATCGEYPILYPCDPHCASTLPFPNRCYWCINDEENGDPHMVDNDTCN